MEIICETQDQEFIPVQVTRLTQRISGYGIAKNQRGVLVTQQHLPLWEFPGGQPRKGETLLEGLVREFKEETGIIIRPLRLILVRESYYLTPSQKVYHSFQNFFTVEIGVDQSVLRKKAKTCWMPVEELNRNNMNIGAYAALQHLLNPSSNWFIPYSKQKI